MISSKVDLSKYEIPKFPLIAKWKRSQLIVLFCNSTCGVTLNSDMHHKIGTYSSAWADICNDDWEVLPKGSSVTLIQG